MAKDISLFSTVIKNISANAVFFGCHKYSQSIPPGGTISIPGDVTSGIYGVDVLEQLAFCMENGLLQLVSTPVRVVSEDGVPYGITVEDGEVVASPLDA